MPRIYLIEDSNHATYYGTKKEARESQRLEEEPEMVQVLDAAAECNGRLKQIRAMENLINNLTYALRGMVDVAPMDVLKETPEGRNAVQLMTKLDPDFIESCGLGEPKD